MLKKAIILNLFIITSVFASFEHFRTSTLKGQTSNPISSVKSSNFKILGDACSADTSCNLTNPCTFGVCDFASNTCSGPKILSIGSPCTLNDYCTNGVCVQNSNFTNGTCQSAIQYSCGCTFTETGQPFDSYPTCYGSFCLQDGKCGYPKSAGLTCSSQFECISNSCISGICAPNKNYGDSCGISITDSCPFDAFCNYGVNSSTCTKYASIGQNCSILTPNSCATDTFCNPISMTCQLANTKTAGQACAGVNDCVISSYCNMTSPTSGTCIGFSSLVGTSCSNTAPCPDQGNSLLCLCTSGSSTCQPASNFNCDSLYTSFISCMMSNCPYLTGDLASQSCMSKNCGNQFAAAYCCLFSNLTNLYAQALYSTALPYLDCNNKSFKGSSCDSVLPHSSSQKHSSTQHSSAHHSSTHSQKHSSTQRSSAHHSSTHSQKHSSNSTHSHNSTHSSSQNHSDASTNSSIAFVLTLFIAIIAGI